MMPFVTPLVVALGAALVLAADVLGVRRVGLVAGLALAAALVASFAFDQSGATAFGAFAFDPAVAYVQRLILVVALICVLGGQGGGEQLFLVLSSVTGMCLLPGARDLLALVVAFELMGIPLYALATFGGRAEAGLKLFLTGAASTAITLFGLSLLVGVSGGTRFATLAAAPPDALRDVGLLLVVAGMAFKLGVVPFHMWVPDTYQGASTPFVAFLSTAPKIAGVVALARLLHGVGIVPAPALLVLAIASMTLGTFLAVPQSSLKRLLGYSGIAHMGFVLLGFASGSTGLVLFYLAAYALTNAGVFLVAHACAAEEIADCAGLSRRQPWLAMALLVFLLSLAGIPFVAGFWAKLYVFIAAWQAGNGALVAAGALLSVLALFFYLGVARAAYVGAPARDGRVPVATPLAAAIIVCLVGVTVMGLWPGPFVDAALAAGAAL